MDLSYIRPKEAVLKLGNPRREYTLRLINLDDENWIRENFGNKLQAALEDPNDLSRIIYRLIKDKSDFKVRGETIIDEEGNEVVEKIGGYMYLKKMVCGMKDKIAMITAFNEVLGVSRPVIDDIDVDDIEDNDDKKKA